jgi:hypothetical protein
MSTVVFSLMKKRAAITQLFRLSNVFAGPTGSGSGTGTSGVASSSQLKASDALATFTLPLGASLEQAVQLLAAQVDRQAQQYDALSATIDAERSTYASLGRPIGGTFIAVGILLLVMGAPRSCRYHLT